MPFNIPNRLLLALLAIAIIIMLYAFISEDLPEISLKLSLGLNFFIFAALFMLIKNGTFIRTREFRIIHAAIAFTIFGILLKIMHWPFAGPVLIISLSMIPAVYFFHFIKKENKVILDYLKLGCVISEIAARIFTIMHREYSDTINYCAIGILAVTITLYLYENINRPAWRAE